MDRKNLLVLAVVALCVWAAIRGGIGGGSAEPSTLQVLVIEEATTERTPEIAEAVAAIQEYCDAHKFGFMCLDDDSDTKYLSAEWAGPFEANKGKEPKPYWAIVAGRKNLSGGVPLPADSAVSTLKKYGGE